MTPAQPPGRPEPPHRPERDIFGRGPREQAIRYVVVGAWNTLFGYAVYGGLTVLLTGRIPHAYMAAAAVSNVAAISMAYLSYKVFVFKTRGGWLREYLRCYVVYGSAALVQISLLPVFVALAGWLIRPKGWAPYIGGAVVTAGAVVFSFFGHRGYTFAGADEGPRARPDAASEDGRAPRGP